LHQENPAIHNWECTWLDLYIMDVKWSCVIVYVMCKGTVCSIVSYIGSLTSFSFYLTSLIFLQYSRPGDLLSVHGDADAALETKIRIEWDKFRQLVPLLTNKDISVIMRGRLYSSCVPSSMLHRSEAWPIRNENEVAFQREEMRMVRRICGVKLQDTEFQVKC